MHTKAGMLLGVQDENSKLLKNRSTRDGFLRRRFEKACVVGSFALLMILVVIIVAFAYCRQNASSGPFQIVRAPIIGDATRDGFARTDANLVFFDDFVSSASLASGLWNPQRSMSGDGNGQFQYYTDNLANLYINTTDGSLRLKPGLFEDLPDINGISARDVMTGNCDDLPACATFEVPECTTPGAGCGGTGAPGALLPSVTSGKVNSSGAFAFQYGRLEFRARMPSGDWLWPGLWMMPQDSDYGIWPNSGEIDIVESRGNAPGYQNDGSSMGSDVIQSTLHYMGNVFWKTQAHGYAAWTEAYHTFGLYWSDRELYTYYLGQGGEEVRLVDLGADRGGYRNGFARAPLGYDNATDADAPQKSELTPIDPRVYDGASPAAPFDKPFYLIFNLAVGGDAGAGCPDPDYWGAAAAWCADCYPDCGPPNTEFYRAKDQWFGPAAAAAAAGVAVAGCSSQFLLPPRPGAGSASDHKGVQLSGWLPFSQLLGAVRASQGTQHGRRQTKMIDWVSPLTGSKFGNDHFVLGGRMWSEGHIILSFLETENDSILAH